MCVWMVILNYLCVVDGFENVVGFVCFVKY